VGKSNKAFADKLILRATAVLAVLVLLVHSEIETGAQDSPARPVSVIAAAEQAYEEGRHHDAIKLYSLAEKQAQGSASVYYGRALAYEMTNQPGKAAEDYKLALKLDPENFRAMENLAGLWERSGRHLQGAAELYKQAMQLDPRPEWKESLAVWVAMIESRLTPADSSAVGCWHIGNEKFLASADKEAEYHYSRALQLNPEMFQAYFSRGLLKAGRGDLNSAREDFDHAVRLHPNLRGALVQRGLVHERMGRREKAMEDFDRAAKLDPRNPQPHYHVGRMLEQDRNPDGAARCYQHALSLRPKPELRALINERLSALNSDSRSDPKRNVRPRPDGKNLW